MQADMVLEEQLRVQHLAGSRRLTKTHGIMGANYIKSTTARIYNIFLQYIYVYYISYAYRNIL